MALGIQKEDGGIRIVEEYATERDGQELIVFDTEHLQRIDDDGDTL